MRTDDKDGMTDGGTDTTRIERAFEKFRVQRGMPDVYVRRKSSNRVRGFFWISSKSYFKMTKDWSIYSQRECQEYLDASPHLY